MVVLHEPFSVYKLLTRTYNEYVNYKSVHFFSSNKSYTYNEIETWSIIQGVGLLQHIVQGVIALISAGRNMSLPDGGPALCLPGSSKVTEALITGRNLFWPHWATPRLTSSTQAVALFRACCTSSRLGCRTCHRYSHFDKVNLVIAYYITHKMSHCNESKIMLNSAMLNVCLYYLLPVVFMKIALPMIAYWKHCTQKKNI